MKFFLGTHQPGWLSDRRFADVPLFISRRRLSRYALLPPAAGCFALDSGGFSELQLYGRWSLTAEEYAEEVRRYVHFYRHRLLWVAPQDWMCEDIVIRGGVAARGVAFAGTGLSVFEHQQRTVENFVRLRQLLGDVVIPVLQGWSLADYQRCRELYKSAGVALEQESTVGVGTICRRQNTDDATQIMQALAADGLHLHGFGFKKGGVKNCHAAMQSADSLAWSDTARRTPVCLPGHDKPGAGRRLGHKNCANCAEWALTWREQLLTEIEVRCAA